MYDNIQVFFHLTNFDTLVLSNTYMFDFFFVCQPFLNFAFVIIKVFKISGLFPLETGRVCNNTDIKQ